MSRLRVYDQTDPSHPRLDTADQAAIARALSEVGVRFEQWKASRVLDEANGRSPASPEPGRNQDEAEVLEAYRDDIERLKGEGGYKSVDVVRMRPDHPDRAAMRAKFLSEHTHSDDEVRFFVDGSGLFSLHIGAAVYLVTCERGDLISVPAGTRHWFDMGESPRFAAIRLFLDPSGWVAQFTGDSIADRFPRHA
jgi:1,2-dihydroxy-3-keto-5-methylthiopentene dioxygenase